MAELRISTDRHAVREHLGFDATSERLRGWELVGGEVPGGVPHREVGTPHPVDIDEDFAEARRPARALAVPR